MLEAKSLILLDLLVTMVESGEIRFVSNLNRMGDQKRDFGRDSVTN